MSIWGALAGGFAGTLVLTTALRAGNELNLTRMDLPFLLGTAFTADRTRAKALGYVLHFLAGIAFALDLLRDLPRDRPQRLVARGGRSGSRTASSPAPRSSTSCSR